MGLQREIARPVLRPILRPILCSRYIGGIGVTPEEESGSAVHAATNPKFYGLVLSDIISGDAGQIATLGYVMKI